MKVLSEQTESLSRFFYKGKPVPSVVAGRYRLKDKFIFQLFSQDLFLDFYRTEDLFLEMAHLEEGDWISVSIEDKISRGYTFKQWHLIQKSLKAEIEAFPHFAKDWEEFLDSVRSFFKSRGLLPVRTPTLLKTVGTEPYLEPFTTTVVLQGKKQKVFLPTSPELSLKKLLCLGGTDFFEIKKCFRNGESGPLHQSEFFLLEWYRAFFSLEELIKDLCCFLDYVKTLPFFKGDSGPVEILTMKELFLKYLKFSLTPQTEKKELKILIKKHGISFSVAESFENLFHLLFLNIIEPQLPQNRPVIVRDYPPALRAYSRLDEEGWASRFELYWRGMELANAFHEVNQSWEQEVLFKEELKKNSHSVRPIDEGLISLMKKGMPPSSGIALGLDRLFAALCEKKNISFFKLGGLDL